MDSLRLLLLLGAVGALAGGFWLADASRDPLREEKSEAVTRAARDLKANLQAREDAADRGVWAKEILAQECGQVFEALWDTVNAAPEKLEAVAGFRFREMTLPAWAPPRDLPHQMRIFEPRAAGPVLTRDQWVARLREFAQGGWRLDNLEFRHNRFDTDPQGQPLRSIFYFAARLTRATPPERAIVEGDLSVEWASEPGRKAKPAVARIDASRLQARSMTGPAPFELVLDEKITPPGRSHYIDPLILYDLDGDGFSEIILPASNLVYHRKDDGSFQPKPLCSLPVERVTTAVIADFDGDGTADLLCANANGLHLFHGNASGLFDGMPKLVWSANPPLVNAMALTCGDVDGDGDLDIFLGQYKVPTLGQVLRPHYYDANDGWPSYLLGNDGQGNFSDLTEAAGLVTNRLRRVYSASLVDLDDDGRMDLAVVSDFAGLDLYRNEGGGRFKEVTREWVPESKAFGMSHTVADFNRDGRLDLLMIGMPSPTVDRLDHLGLSRNYSPEDARMRAAMSFGNRLYLAKPGGGFSRSALGDSLARSGWSWGCSAFDFDNDGWPDLYVANGLESRQTVRDYEPEFWLHDLYIDDAVDSFAATGYFIDKFNRTRGSGWSYGGYEKNRLYLNQQGRAFVEAGHLAGVALEQDCRNVVADDLDGDGRVDLLVATLEVWPELRQTTRVYRNTLAAAGHWIGFRFQEQPGRSSPVGARVVIRAQDNASIAVQQVVTGASHRSQSAPVVHFGLGEIDRVGEVEIRWPRGERLLLQDLAADRYYDVYCPARR